MSQPERSRTEWLAENWPILARLTGTGMGLTEMAASFFGLPVSSAVLGFAGGLLLAPNVAGVQRRRNDQRRARAAKAVADLIAPQPDEGDDSP